MVGSIVEAVYGSGVAVNPAGATLGPRVTATYELVLMEQGGAVHEADGVERELPQGAMIFCRPSAHEVWRWDRRRWSRHTYIHFALGRLPANWPRVEVWPVVTPGAAATVLGALLSHVVDTSEPVPDEHRRRVVEVILSTLAHGVSPSSGSIPPALSIPVQRALEMIDRRLDADPSARLELTDLAKAASVSREHLCRLFRRELGVSPMQSLQQARLDHALAMLIRSNEQVSTIAQRCGFANPYHFSRSFKQTFGSSPRGVRKAIGSNQPPPLPSRRRWSRQNDGGD